MTHNHLSLVQSQVSPHIVIIYVLFLMLNGLAVKLVHFFIGVCFLYITIIKQKTSNHQII